MVTQRGSRSPKIQAQVCVPQPGTCSFLPAQAPGCPARALLSGKADQRAYSLCWTLLGQPRHRKLVRFVFCLVLNTDRHRTQAAGRQ